VLSSNLRIAPEGIRLDGLNLVVAGVGKITGAGTIDANKSLDFKMLAEMASGGAIGDLASRVGLTGVAQGGIPFLIQGTTAKPVFVPDTKGLVKAGISNMVKPPATGGKPTIVDDVLGGFLGGGKKQ
jgi:hypothetical protein